MKVELAGVSKVFGRRRVLNKLWLELPDTGCIIALVGINGAGKSTLLQLLAGLLGPTEGNVLFDDEPFRRDRLDQRRRFGFLPDFPAAFAHFTPIQHIAMMLELYDRPLDEAAGQRSLELLRVFQLLPLADRPLGTLSRGQIYKAALCGLVMANPELWLLDEPLASGMDPLGLLAFKRLAREAANAGRTIIYSTQVLSLAEQFSDEVIILHDAEVRARGPVADLIRRSREAAASVDKDNSVAGLEGVFAALQEDRENI